MTKGEAVRCIEDYELFECGNINGEEGCYICYSESNGKQMESQREATGKRIGKSKESQRNAKGMPERKSKGKPNERQRNAKGKRKESNRKAT